MQSIAIFYASEGTGHKIAAENLAEQFRLQNPDGNVLCFDILDCVPKLLKLGFSNYYLWTVRYLPKLWGASYRSSDKQGLTKFCCDTAHSLLCKLFLSRAEKKARQIGAEAVFFTHYFGAEHFAKRNPDIKTFCITTDFETHTFQRAGKFCASFVASEAALAQYAKENISPVYFTGIPIAQKFSQLPSKELARQQLGISFDTKVILISGGGIGVGNIEEITSSLATCNTWQIIVICGNNKHLEKKLEKKYAKIKNVRIHGFVSNIELYYKAADIAIVKPGGLTLAETLACQVPLLLMQPVPGQEECNLRCVCNEIAAIKLNNGKHAFDTVKMLFEQPQKLTKLQENAKRIAKPNAAKKILDIASTYCN